MGLEESKVVQDVSRQKAAQVLAQRGRLPHNDEGDEESEEPEDDDMEIEKLQVKQTYYFSHFACGKECWSFMSLTKTLV